jgi:hypothetical protein
LTILNVRHIYTHAEKSRSSTSPLAISIMSLARGTLAEAVRHLQAAERACAARKAREWDTFVKS